MQLTVTVLVFIYLFFVRNKVMQWMEVKWKFTSSHLCFIPSAFPAPQISTNASTPPSVALTLSAPTHLELIPVPATSAMRQLTQNWIQAKRTSVSVIEQMMTFPSDRDICDFTCVQMMFADVGECERHATVCGPHANCTNGIGSYYCDCYSGFRLNNLEVIASYANPCTGLYFFFLYAPGEPLVLLPKPCFSLSLQT